MANERQKLVHLHSATVKTPSVDLLEKGEIAVQYAASDPALYIVNSNDEVVKFIASGAVDSAINTVKSDFTTEIGGVVSDLETLSGSVESFSGEVASKFDQIHTHDNKTVLDGITSAKVSAWDDAEQNAKDFATGADATLKATIDAYTVNEKNISDSPVLDGSDIKTSSAYTKASAVTAITAGDTVDVALGKLEKQIDNAVAGGLQQVKAGDGIEVTNVVGNEQTISVKITEDALTYNLLTKGSDAGLMVNEEVLEDWTNNLIDAKIEDLDATVGSAAVATGKHVAVQIVEADGKLSAVTVTENDIASANDLDTLSGNVETAINDAVEDAQDYIDEAIAAETGRTEAAYAAIAYQGKVDTLIGSDANKSVRAIATEEAAAAVADVVDGAPESFDTLKEIAEWIAEDPTHSAEIVTDIEALEGRMDTAEGDIDNLETAVSALEEDAHTHSNKTVLDGITSAKVSAWDDAATSAHSHSNKALLDSYTQTNDDLANAVEKAHEHANADVLDEITSTKVANWDNASTSAHSHSNKALLDTYTQTEANLADAVAKKHEHTNKTVLDGITAEDVAAWDAAENNAKAFATGLDTAMDARVDALEADTHTHDNKDELDLIQSGDVAKWNAKQDAIPENTYDAYGAASTAKSEAIASANSYTNTAVANLVSGANGDSYVSASVANNTVSVAATSSTIASLALADTSLQGIAEGKESGVSVNTNKKLDFSNLSINCGEY